MLTDTKLRTLKAKAKLYRVADTNGLCIEVRTNGARIWRYRYRYAGKASMVGLGEYPAVPLTEARAERDRLRLLVKGGGTRRTSPGPNVRPSWSMPRPPLPRSPLSCWRSGRRKG